PDARDGALKLHQDAELSLVVLPEEEKLNYLLRAGRRAWLQVARGKVALNGSTLEAGDGAAINDEQALDLAAIDQSEILLFDLA
ncbi:MAG: pirin family protein, partial [Candidatus Binatia bacterium]